MCVLAHDAHDPHDCLSKFLFMHLIFFTCFMAYYVLSLLLCGWCGLSNDAKCDARDVQNIGSSIKRQALTTKSNKIKDYSNFFDISLF